MNTNLTSKMTHLLFVALVAVSLVAGTAFAQEKPGRLETGKGEGSGYVLGPDDVIRIFVEDHPEWSGDFTIKPDGTILLRDIGEIKVDGQTKEELKATLIRALGRYITNPRVTIDMLQYRSQVIYVLGEVNRPGEYSTAGKKITLRDAIVMAGLPGRFAATGRVFVISPNPRRPRQQVVNLYRILYRGETQYNIAVEPGDIVYVPQTLLGKVNDFISAILSPLDQYRVVTGAPVIP